MDKKLNESFIFIRSDESDNVLRERIAQALRIRHDEIIRLTEKSVILNLLDVEMNGGTHDGYGHFTWMYFKDKSKYKIFRIPKILATDKDLIRCLSRKYSGIIDKSVLRSILNACEQNGVYKIRDLKKNF